MNINMVQTPSYKLGLVTVEGKTIAISINMNVEKYIIIAEYLASLSASTSTFRVRNASTSPITWRTILNNIVKTTNTAKYTELPQTI